MAKARKNQDRLFAAVTGASSGIGYELAKQFAQNGFDLLVVAENPEIHEVISEFEKLGARATAVQIDLASKKGVRQFYQEITRMGRPLDAIAINAGVGLGGDFIEQDLAEVINLINLNVTSLVHLSQLVLKDMVARGEGKILFTSSIASTAPAAHMAVYHASKAFVQSFVTGVREELREAGHKEITLTSLMPGATETEFFHRAGLDDTKVGQSEKDLPGEVAKEGFDALMAGKEHVVGGSWSNTATVLLGKVTPEGAKAKQAGKEYEPAKS